MNYLVTRELQRILPLYGSDRKIAARIGVGNNLVSAARNGSSLPSTELVEKLIDGMPVAHQVAIVTAYLLDLRPSNAPMVQVGATLDVTDRLQLACAALPESARALLAVVVEAINRDPEAGYKTLEGLAKLLAPEDVVSEAKEAARLNEPSTKYEA